jgi:hypothetical protein
MMSLVTFAIRYFILKYAQVDMLMRKINPTDRMSFETRLWRILFKLVLINL